MLDGLRGVVDKLSEKPIPPRFAFASDDIDGKDDGSEKYKEQRERFFNIYGRYPDPPAPRIVHRLHTAAPPFVAQEALQGDRWFALRDLMIDDFKGPWNKFPNLRTLSIKVTSRVEPILDFLPNSLEQLEIDCVEDPTKRYSYQNLPFEFPIVIPKLPASLRVLMLYNCTGTYVDRLPDGLEHLEIGGAFTKPLHFFPKGLKKLVFMNACIHDIPDLPPTLEILVLNNIRCFEIAPLPTQLKKLYICSRLKYSPRITLPLTCEKIYFDNREVKRLMKECGNHNLYTKTKTHDAMKDFMPEIMAGRLKYNEVYTRNAESSASGKPLRTPGKRNGVEGGEEIDEEFLEWIKSNVKGPVYYKKLV